MSNLSGYDSEAVGFDSVSQCQRSEACNSTQTSEFQENIACTQTRVSKDCGCMTSSEDFKTETLNEYPPNLNEFLRKVVPTVLEQLDQNDRELLYNSSDSDEDELLNAKLFQDIKIKIDTIGAGDQEIPPILDLSWSSAGNSLAVTLGMAQHKDWCEHDGLIKIYTAKRSEGDKLSHILDIAEKNCVSVLKYHHSVAGLLAYGTVSGEIVICDLRCFDEGQLTSPSGCHDSKRVSNLQWADLSLANIFLMMQIVNSRRRRGASDQVLISAGSDGTVNVWQVNANLKIFSNVICYKLNGSKKTAAPDITTLDFVKSFPLRPFDEKLSEDTFVVGTVSGQIFVCKTKNCQQILNSNMFDPVHGVLEGHSTCIVEIAFSNQMPGVFASISIDSELRLYDVNQLSPLKIITLDMAISCMCWLPNSPCVVIGMDRGDRKDQLRVYNVFSGRTVPIEGLIGESGVTRVAVNRSGEVNSVPLIFRSCRVAAGCDDGTVRVWDIPSRRMRFAPEDLEF